MVWSTNVSKPKPCSQASPVPCFPPWEAKKAIVNCATEDESHPKFGLRKICALAWTVLRVEVETPRLPVYLDSMVKIALLICGSLTGKARVRNADYHDIYLRYLTNSCPQGTNFVLDPYQVRLKMEYPEHDNDYNCMILTGSRELSRFSSCAIMPT